MNFFRKTFRSLFDGFSLWRKLGSHASIIEVLRTRIIFSCVLGTVTFGVVVYRLSDIMVIRNIVGNKVAKVVEQNNELKADILDRNGNILATSIVTASCYVDPSIVISLDELVSKLSKIDGMPRPTVIAEKIKDKDKHFVWLARHITPQVRQQIMDLGIPGIFFKKDYKRIYTHGNLLSHIIGCTDIDGNGVSGLEKQYNCELAEHGRTNKKLILSIDVRVQSVVHEELSNAINKFSAIGGNAIVMDSRNGEIIAMVSLPDFNPNSMKHCDVDNMFNRNTLGINEPGSTFKILNTAIALESGAAKINSIFDATSAVRIGRFSVTDFRGKNRALSLAEAFVFSSNIAAIKISQQFGIKTQKEYFKKFGIFDKCNLEIPEVGKPMLPRVWSEATSMTASYGYGIAVSPLQTIVSVASIVNDGNKVNPTLIFAGNRRNNCEKIVSENTSYLMRDLMRAAVCYGTAKKAGVDDVEIFGKTGTAYKTKSSRRGYGTGTNRSRITTFVGGFSKKNPRYVMILMLDDPKPIEGTYGYATAGWNAAPTAGNIFKRIVPILGNQEDEPTTELTVTKYIKLN